MVHKVVWSELAIKTHVSNIEYLEKEWMEREVGNFIKDIRRKIILLSMQPRTGVISNKRKNLRKTILNKRIVLIYRHKPLKKEIELGGSSTLINAH